jgi:hypothetical protein
VVTDNDGDVEAVASKYEPFKGNKDILICFDEVVDQGDLKVAGKPYNYNTLEPKLLKANDLKTLNEVLGKAYKTEDELRKYMRSNKTDCALFIFSSNLAIKFPEYITKAIGL